MSNTENDGVEQGGGVDRIAERIRTFSESVETPDDWMIIVPVDDYNDVVDALDTTNKAGRYYQGISLCYSERAIDEPQVELKRSLADQLRTTGHL